MKCLYHHHIFVFRLHVGPEVEGGQQGVGGGPGAGQAGQAGAHVCRVVGAGAAVVGRGHADCDLGHRLRRWISKFSGFLGLPILFYPERASVCTRWRR